MRDSSINTNGVNNVFKSRLPKIHLNASECGNWYHSILRHWIQLADRLESGIIYVITMMSQLTLIDRLFFAGLAITSRWNGT